MKQNTVVTLAAMKVRGEKISQLTCYDYATACLMDQAGVNMVLVGDSLGMTMQGLRRHPPRYPGGDDPLWPAVVAAAKPSWW